MYYRSEFILPISAEAIPEGAVRVEEGRIVAIGPARDLVPQPGETVVDLGASVLLPGLINAHCHLDYTHYKGAINPQDSFTDWIKQINALKRSFSPEDFLTAIADGFIQAAETGTTTIANIEALPELLPRLPRPPLRTWWFLELIDVRTRINEDETLLGALSFFEQHPDWLGGFGLSPHAPYTASVDLYRLARTCGENYGMICTTHIAESVEEHEMFNYGRGALYDFMASLGRDNGDCGQGSAVSHLIEHGVIGSNCLIAHLNYLLDYDYELLADTGASIVHCPKCHTYFGHSPFPLKRLKSYGLNICLGTDSLASNNSLDMRSEMREVQLHHHLTDHEVLEMATIHGAKALGQTGLLGEIKPGAWADLVAFPIHEPSRAEGKINPYREVVLSRKKPSLLLVQGEPIKD